MKKKLTAISAVLAVAVLSVCMVACTPKEKVDPIVGTWQIQAMGSDVGGTYYEWTAGCTTPTPMPATAHVFTFNQDGTFSYSFNQMGFGEGTDTGTWVLTDGKYVLTKKDGTPSHQFALTGDNTLLSGSKADDSPFYMEFVKVQ